MIIRRFFDAVCFVGGPIITVYFLLSVRHGGGRSGGLTEGFSPIFYYYPNTSKIGMGVGIALICLGFLRIYWRKKEWDKEKPK
jgi:hypothetical protein